MTEAENPRRSDYSHATELTLVLGMLHGGLSRPELRTLMTEFARNDTVLREHLLGLRNQLNAVLRDSAWIGAPV